MTCVFVITVFELLDASGDSCVAQSLLVQSQGAEGRGQVKQSRSVRLVSPLLLEEVKS